MKINLFLFSIVILFFCSCSTEKKQSDREKDGIKGNVESISSISYIAIDKFGQGDIVKGRPAPFGSAYLLYDSLGNILESKHYYLSKCHKMYESEQNKNGKLVKFLYFDEDDSKILLGHEYEYDNKGNVILEIDLIDGSRDIIKNQYDENGRLVLQKGKLRDNSYTYTEDGKVKEWYKGYPHYEKRHETYEYDEKGNKTKAIVIFTPKSKYERCVLYKYDNQNRQIDEITINNPDPDKGETTQRTKYYYKDNATLPYRTTTWGKSGSIEDETYSVWFLNGTDTASILILDQNIHPIRLIDRHKKQDNVVKINYDMEAEIYLSNIYNYSDGILQSKTDKDGNISSYEYEGNELKTITEQLTDGKKCIITYNKGKIQSKTFYDQHNKIENACSYEYTGEDNDGTQLIKSTNAENKTSITELIFKNGKLIQSKNTQNGIVEITDNEYNEKGDLICANNKSKGEKLTYTYKYDPFDNWYYRIQFRNDKAELITERSIQYFNPR